MKTYEESLRDYEESLCLGYSAKETIEGLENDEEVNVTLLNELQHALKYGV